MTSRVAAKRKIAHCDLMICLSLLDWPICWFAKTIEQNSKVNKDDLGKNGQIGMYKKNVIVHRLPMQQRN